MKATMFVPDASFGLADADAVLSELKDLDGGGLASVEVIAGKGGQAPRLFLSTRQTLNMLVRAARGSVSDDERDAELARTAERVTTSGPFKTVLFVRGDAHRPGRDVLATAGIDDARATRLIVLDPRQFSLLNGIDRETRSAVRAAMGIGPERLPVKWASSAVYAIVNSQRRGQARGAALSYLAWDRVSEMADVKADEELAQKAQAELAEARRNLNTAVKRAYQHVMYLGVGDEAAGEARIDRTITFEHEETSLDGLTVWKALVDAGKAFDVETFSGRALLHQLRADDYGKPLDEVRDLFWTAPRMPLLPAGEADLQRAIHEAVQAGKLRLVGSDGSERHVTRPSEIGVGQSGLRLEKPVLIRVCPRCQKPKHPGPCAVVKLCPACGKPEHPGRPCVTPAPEKQFTAVVRASLSSDAARDDVYQLLLKVSDVVDQGAVSYTELMLRLQISADRADDLANLARATGAQVDVREG